MTLKQVQNVQSSAILGWKRYIESKSVTSNRVVPSNDLLNSLTWLQLSLSTPSSMVSQLTQHSILSLTDETYQGFLNNSQLFDEHFFSMVGVNTLGFLLQDTIGSMTKQQIKYLNPNAFLSTVSFGPKFKYIAPSAIPGVTQQQLGNMLVQNFLGQVATCKQYKAMTADQLSQISGTFSQQQLMQRCYKPTYTK